MRNISKYTEDYLKPNFEDYQVIYRKKKIMEVLSLYQHYHILEIGCGMEPLFCYLEEDDFADYTVIEPSVTFYENACIEAKKRRNVNCINGFFHASDEKLGRLSENYPHGYS